MGMTMCGGEGREEMEAGKEGGGGWHLQRVQMCIHNQCVFVYKSHHIQ